MPYAGCRASCAARDAAKGPQPARRVSFRGRARPRPWWPRRRLHERTGHVRCGESGRLGRRGSLTSERVGRQLEQAGAPAHEARRFRSFVGRAAAPAPLPRPRRRGGLSLAAASTSSFTLLVRGCMWPSPRPRVVPARLPMPSRHHRDRCSRSSLPCTPHIASSPPETLGCEDIRFVVVLGSDPCDLHRGEKGWRVRRLFSHREGSQRRTGGVQHATTRALRDFEKSAKDHTPIWGSMGWGRTWRFK